MEACNSLQSYWGKRTYHRLEGASEKQSVVRLGGGRRRKSSWRRSIKVRVKLLRRISSPKKLLISMRDAYVNAMLVFSGRTEQTKKIKSPLPKAPKATHSEKLSEFERRMIVHIYNTVMTRPEELVSCV